MVKGKVQGQGQATRSPHSSSDQFELKALNSILEFKILGPKLFPKLFDPILETILLSGFKCHLNVPHTKTSLLCTSYLINRRGKIYISMFAKLLYIKCDLQFENVNLLSVLSNCWVSCIGIYFCCITASTLLYSKNLKRTPNEWIARANAREKVDCS